MQFVTHTRIYFAQLDFHVILDTVCPDTMAGHVHSCRLGDVLMISGIFHASSKYSIQPE